MQDQPPSAIKKQKKRLKALFYLQKVRDITTT